MKKETKLWIGLGITFLSVVTFFMLFGVLDTEYELLVINDLWLLVLIIPFIIMTELCFFLQIEIDGIKPIKELKDMKLVSILASVALNLLALLFYILLKIIFENIKLFLRFSIIILTIVLGAYLLYKAFNFWVNLNIKMVGKK